MSEQQRIVEAYKRRRQQARTGFYIYENLAHLCRIQERHRETLKLLGSSGFHSLSECRLLVVGCGDGNMLRQFLGWGVSPGNLAGIELCPEPVGYARRLHPNLDIRCGSATSLPWPDASFDLVCQHTVFTSILDPLMKEAIAEEIGRVLCSGGAVLWYDFMYNNPPQPGCTRH